MAPRNGVRFTLRLRSETPMVHYEYEADALGEHHEGRVRVARDDGRVEFEDGDALPAPVKQSIHALMRSLWRARNQSDLAWPRRLKRWREFDLSDEP